MSDQTAESGSAQGSLSGRVVVVAGAGGSAGPAVVRRLAAAGASVAALERDADLVAALVEEDPAHVHAYAVDLLDEQASLDLAATVRGDLGRVDGLVHLVGGWRGGKSITQSDLADWDFLEKMSVRTLQHTSRAFYDDIRASHAGRVVMISTVQVGAPSATNASYVAAKAAAESWTLALADSFKDTDAAAVIFAAKALLTPQMRETKPAAKFSGYTAVDDLGAAVVDLWSHPADELNGTRRRLDS